MTDAEQPWTQVPVGWTPPDATLLERAREQSLRALSLEGARPAHHRLRSFYDIDSDYAGASFAQLQPIDPHDLTATDLHATSLLSVRVGPGATRRLLNEGPTRTEILTYLRAIPDTELHVADNRALLAMQDLYRAIKTALAAASTRRPDAWVTASKICARKRPDLYPVRDTRIRDHLGIPTKNNGYATTWLLIRTLIQDRDIITAIDAAADAATDGHPRVRLDTPRLRLLDAALWTATLR